MVSVFPRGPIRGGIEAAASQLVASLAHCAELELHVAAFHWSVSRPFHELHENVHLHWLPRWTRGSTMQMLSVGAAQVARIERHIRPDITHAQGPTPLGLAARFSRRPMVLTVHGLEMLSQHASRMHTFGGPLGPVRRLTAGLVMQMSLQRANGVILISPYVSEFVGRYASEKKLTAAIDNPVAPAFFDRPSPPGDERLLCVANLSELKNQALLVRAFGRIADRHPHAKLLLAGPPTDAGYAARLRVLIESLQLAQRVCVLGEAAPEHVLELYAESDLVLLGSVQETAPLAIAQAMSAGRAVLATAVGGVQFMVRDGVTGTLVPSDDEPAMAMAMARALSDPEDTRAMGRAAQSEALQRFHPRSIAAQTTDFYKRVLEAPCGS